MPIRGTSTLSEQELKQANDYVTRVVPQSEKLTGNFVTPPILYDGYIHMYNQHESPNWHFCNMWFCTDAGLANYFRIECTSDAMVWCVPVMLWCGVYQ